MNTSTLKAQSSRIRRNHTPEFKAQVIAACLQPGTSVAAVALANQLNANYLRSLVTEHRKRHGGLPATLKRHSATRPVPTLVPVTIQTAETASSGDIQIEIRRQQTVFQITWPASQAEACAQWLRDVLR